MAIRSFCRIWAHRTSAMERPENTVIGIKHSASIGTDGVEFDVRLSKDGVPVVIHDSTVDRTTNGTGLVRDKTVRELKQLDAGYYFRRDGKYPYRGKGITIPTLEEAVTAAACLPMNIEIKENDPHLAWGVAGVLAKRSIGNKVLIASPYAKQLQLMRELASKNIEIAASPLETLMWLAFGANCGIQAVEFPCKYKGIDFKGLIPLLKYRSCKEKTRVFIWTVNGPINIRRWLSTGLYAILSDEPSTAIRIRRAMTRENLV